jgi:hypothetical protein
MSKEQALLTLQNLKQRYGIKPITYDNSTEMDVQQVCNGCKETKSLSEFGKTMRKGIAMYYRCRACNVKQTQKSQNTLNGFLNVMLNNSKSKSKLRSDTGRTANHTLTIAQLKQMVLDQEGNCFISGQTLKFQQRSEWQASLERKNNDLDYSWENCCLIALEFNTAAQWTRKKFNYAFSHTETVDHDMIGLAAIPPFVSAEKFNRSAQFKDINGVKMYRCNGCASWKSAEQFTRHKESNCFSCKELSNDAQSNTWLPIFNKLTHHAKHRSNRRASAGRTNMHGVMTLDDVIEIYIDQLGLCAYSGLQLRQSGDWKCSLERIDTSIGYFPFNCCLIVMELNSIDRSADSKTEYLSSGWSKEKYLKLREQVKNNVL